MKERRVISDETVSESDFFESESSSDFFDDLESESLSDFFDDLESESLFLSDFFDDLESESESLSDFFDDLESESESLSDFFDDLESESESLSDFFDDLESESFSVFSEVVSFESDSLDFGFKTSFCEGTLTGSKTDRSPFCEVLDAIRRNTAMVINAGIIEIIARFIFSLSDRDCLTTLITIGTVENRNPQTNKNFDKGFKASAIAHEVGIIPAKI